MSTQHISFGFDGEESEEEEQRGVEGILRLDSETFQLLEGENAVGRGDKNDIILDDQSVSDNHAVITVLPGGASILVKDLDSTNKTRYQATEDASWEVIKAKKPVTLSHGARLRFGALEATVLLGTEAVMAGAPTQAVNELNIEDEATDDEGGEAEDAGLRNEVTQAVPEYDEEEEEEAKGGTVAQSHDSSPATVPMKVVGEDKEGGAAAEEKPKNEGAEEEEEEEEGDDASADLMDGADTFVSDAEEEEEEAVAEEKADGEEGKEAERRVSVAPSEHTAVEEDDTATEGEEEVEEETAKENHPMADANIAAAGEREGEKAKDLGSGEEDEADVAERAQEQATGNPEVEDEGEHEDKGKTAVEEDDEATDDEAGRGMAETAAEAEVQSEEGAVVEEGGKGEEGEGTAAMDVQGEGDAPAALHVEAEGEGEEKEQGGEGSDGDNLPSGPPTPNTLPPPTQQKPAAGAAARGQVGSPILEGEEEYASAEEVEQDKGEEEQAEKKPDDVEDEGKDKEPEVQEEEGPGDKKAQASPVPKRGRKKAEDTQTDEEAPASSRKPRGKAAGGAKAVAAKQSETVVEEEAEPEAKPAEPEEKPETKPEAKGAAGRKPRGKAKAAESHVDVQEADGKGDEGDKQGGDAEVPTTGRQGRGKGRAAAKAKEPSQPVEEEEEKEEKAAGRAGKRGRKGPVIKQEKKEAAAGKEKDKEPEKEKEQEKEQEEEPEEDKKEEVAEEAAGGRGARRGRKAPVVVKQEKQATKAPEKVVEKEAAKGKDKAVAKEPTKGKGKAAEKEASQVKDKGDEGEGEAEAEPTTRGGRGRGAKREAAAAVKEEKEAAVATGASKRARRGAAEEAPAEEEKPKEEEKKGKGKPPVVKKEPVATASRGKKAAEKHDKEEDESAMQVEEEGEVQPKRGRKRPPPAGHVPLVVVKEEKQAGGGKKARGSTSSQSSEPSTGKGRRSTASRDGEEESQASLSMQLREGQQQRLRVAFSGVKAEQREKTILHNLSCELVEDALQADVLVAASLKDGIKFGRRPKALACLARGLPIVDLSWLDACAKDNTVLRPAEHVLVDKEAEKKWGFGMGESMERANAGRLLEGWGVLVVSKKMGSGMPPAEDFQLMAEAAGGRWMGDKPKIGDVKAAAEEHVLVISDETSLGDAKLQALAHQAAEAKATHVYSLEALLSGLLRQKLSLKDNILWRNPAATEGKGKGGKAAGVQAEAGPARASRRAK